VKMGPTRCPETSVNNYHMTPCNYPEDHRLHQHRGRSLKSRIIAFTRKTNVLYYVYKICESSITCTDSIKNLGVGPTFDSTLHFHAHVDYIFSQSIRMLGSIRNITYLLSTLDSLLMLLDTHFSRPQLCGIV
jgi:hypothetical protein